VEKTVNKDHNSGELKLELITKGVRLDRSALSSSEIVRALDIDNQVNNPLELDLILPGKVLVNIAIQECLDRETNYFLIKEGEDFYVVKEDLKVKVYLESPPKFYDQLTSSGKIMAKVGRKYGDYLLVTPTGACEFLSGDMACKYCDVDAKKTDDKSVQDVLETIEAALAEGAAEFVCINVGYISSDDGGISMVLPFVKAIKAKFDVLICVQAQPPKTDEWIDITYASGIDSLAYNLEVYDAEIFKRIAPGKMSLVGRDRYFQALARAARVFPSGSIVSNLIIGLEPLESTYKGIDILTAMGVVPTLPIFRPVPDSDLTSFFDLSPESLSPIYVHLQDALKRNRLSSSWISHFNVVVNAIDAHYFGGEAPVKRQWPAVLKSKKRNKLALNLRRRLRVRTADDNESTGL